MRVSLKRFVPPLPNPLLLVFAANILIADPHPYVICVEDERNLESAQELTDILNDDFVDGDLAFSAVLAGSMHEVVRMMRAGECNIVELDAGKSLGVAMDPTILAEPLAQESSGSYLTMAIARKDKLDADGITTFCDIAQKGDWKACHTGYMKSAGWLSPMAALHECNVDAVEDICSDLTLPGTACHNEAFGNSCVPGMVDDLGQPLSSPDQEICMACMDAADNDDGFCNDTTNSGYSGAAQGTLEGNCDISFVKTVTIECPEEGQGGYCKSKVQAACTENNSCDSKSVYANDIDVAEDTFVRVPGYGSRVPAHLIMQTGLTTAHAEQLMGKLGHAWTSIHDKVLRYELGTPIVDILGDAFVESLQHIPGLYEYYGLTRPTKSTIIIQDDSLSDGAVVAIVAGEVLAVGITAYLAITKGPDCRAACKRYGSHNAMGSDAGRSQV